MEPGDLVAAGAAAGAELEAALGEVIEHRHPLGDLRRVVDLGQWVEDPRPEVGARRAPGERAEEHVVGRDVRVLVEEVVLGDPDVLETGAVGGDDGGQLVHERPVLGLRITFAAEGRVVPLDEQTELHRALSCSLPCGHPSTRQ